MVKNPPANAGDMSSVSGLGKFLGVGNNQLRYSCLGKSHGQKPGWLQSMGLQRVGRDIWRRDSEDPIISDIMSYLMNKEV